MIPSNLRRHMVDVTVEPCTSVDSAGKRTGFGPAVTYKARYVSKQQPVGTDAKGKTVVSNGQLIFDRVVIIASIDRITLNDGSQPTINHVGTSPSGQGGSLGHTVVYL